MSLQSIWSLINKSVLILAGFSLFLSDVMAQSSSGKTFTIQSDVYSVAPTQAGDKELGMDLYIPQKDSIKGAVILIHGGSFVTGSREIQENEVYGKALAKRGYLAAAISYRLHRDQPVIDGWANTYAKEIKHSPDRLVQAVIDQYGSDWPTAVAASAQDIVAAINWLQNKASNLGFNPEKIALFGASAGAISSLTIAYALDNYGAKPVDISAVIDLRGLLVQHNELKSLIESTDPPLLMFHGEADKRALPHYADSLFKFAKEAGIHVELFTAPEFGHELGSHSFLKLKVDSGDSVLDLIDNFLHKSFNNDFGPVKSLRSRLFPVDHQLEIDSQHLKTGGMIVPNDSLFRSDMRLAVNNLIQLVRDESDFVPNLYGISKEEMLIQNFKDFSRIDWSYWPRERDGLPIKHMNAAQRRQTHQILSTLLSSKGYLQVNHIMMLEEILADTEIFGFVRGADEYMITLFGEPSIEAPWGVRFEGHHISLNLTFTPDRISVTPTFLGAFPAPLTEGIRAGFNPLKYEQHYALSLLKSFDENQRTAAVLANTPLDEVLTTQFQIDSTEWDKWQSRLSKDGISASTFNTRQKQLLRSILLEIVGTYREEISIKYLKNIDLNLLTFAWMGESEVGRPHYFRIQGKDFVFELDAAQGDGKHVHTVWRDRENDFGGDPLIDHYKSHAH